MKKPKRSTFLHLLGTLKWTISAVEIGHLAHGDGITNEAMLLVALVSSIGRLTPFLPLPLPPDPELDILKL